MNTRKRPSHGVKCVSNQKQIALAVIMMVNDRDLRELPWRIPGSEGGTQTEIGFKTGEAWAEFYDMREYLQDPAVLACPMDDSRNNIRLDHWDDQTSRGLSHHRNRDNAISYFINLDCGTRTGDNNTVTSWEMAQSQVITGDRNLRVDRPSVSCSTRVNNAAGIQIETPDQNWGKAGWTNGLHGHKGVLAVVDGSVSINTQDGLRKLLFQSNDKGFVHLLIP